MLLSSRYAVSTIDLMLCSGTVPANCIGVQLPLMFAAVTATKNWLPDSGPVVEPMPDNESRSPNILADVKAKIEQELIPTFVSGAVYWPFVNIIVFQYVPVQRRAIVNSFFGVLWNIYVSAKANADIRED